MTEILKLFCRSIGYFSVSARFIYSRNPFKKLQYYITLVSSQDSVQSSLRSLRMFIEVDSKTYLVGELIGGVSLLWKY